MKYLKRQIGQVLKLIKFLWQHRLVLPPLIAILCLLWLTAYYWMTGWWMKEKVVTVPHINFVRTAHARELTVEEYVCTKDWDCKTALAVAKAESGMRCDAQNVNTNGSVDAGLWQVNSIHLKKGWKLADLLDCFKSTDYAYELYQAQGFSPWVAYSSKAYLKYLN